MSVETKTQARQNYRQTLELIVREVVPDAKQETVENFVERLMALTDVWAQYHETDPERVEDAVRVIDAWVEENRIMLQGVSPDWEQMAIDMEGEVALDALFASSASSLYRRLEIHPKVQQALVVIRGQAAEARTWLKDRIAALYATSSTPGYIHPLDKALCAYLYLWFKLQEMRPDVLQEMELGRVLPPLGDTWFESRRFLSLLKEKQYFEKAG